MRNIVCFYHDKCADGLAAAAALYNEMGNLTIEFIPSSYGDPLPDWVDEDLSDAQQRHYDEIFILDFSFPHDKLLELAKYTDSLVVLDHHKTAKDALTGENKVYPRNVFIKFDMKKSGAQLAWDFFARGNQDWWTRGVELVADRDLWIWEYGENSKLFHQAVNIEIIQRDDWAPETKINKMLELLSQPKAAIERGKLYQPLWDLMVRDFASRAIPNFAEVLRKDGPSSQIIYTCWCPPMFSSDVGHAICDVHPEAVAMCLSHDVAAGGIKASFRRSTNAEDYVISAEVLAKRNLGGGGHKNAAGCFVSYDYIAVNHMEDFVLSFGQLKLQDAIL